MLPNECANTKDQGDLSDDKMKILGNSISEAQSTITALDRLVSSTTANTATSSDITRITTNLNSMSEAVCKMMADQNACNKEICYGTAVTKSAKSLCMAKYNNEIQNILTKQNRIRDKVQILTESHTIQERSATTSPILPQRKPSVSNQRHVNDLIIDLSPDRHSDMLSIRENLGNTSEVYDELDRLLQNQCPGISALESDAANIRNVTKNTVKELSRAYQRKKTRAKRLWWVFGLFMFLAIIFIYSQISRSNTDVPTELPNVEVPDTNVIP